MESETIVSDDHALPRRVGAVLGEARAAAGLDLVDIARDTRVPLRHLTAIEADAHDNLPALPYAIGFVKAFARAVGVDPDAAAAQFRGETSKTAHTPAPPPMTPLDERRLPPRGLLAASVLGVVVVVGLVVAYSAGAFDGPLPAEPATVVAEAPVPVPTPAAVVAPLPASVAPPSATLPVATGPGRVAITASEDAWFRVSGWDAAAGKAVTVKTGVLAKGESYAVPPTPGLTLWTGRAGALQLSVDGRALPLLGGPVETVKNVSLDAADLLARPAPVAVPAVVQ